MEVLTDVKGLVAHVARLPEAELTRKDYRAVGVFAGFELCEKLCRNRGLGVHFLVGWATIDQEEVPVNRRVAFLFGRRPTVSVFWVVHVFSTTIENDDDVGAKFLTADPSKRL